MFQKREADVHECTTSEGLQLNLALPLAHSVLFKVDLKQAESSNHQMSVIQHGIN